MSAFLVTGGCGFIGSNLVLHLLEEHPEADVANLDALTYAADRSNLQEAARNPRYFFHHVDVADRAAVRRVLEQVQPTGIFHLAAETHVDNSIRDAEPFVHANFVGTYILLDEAKRLWDGDTSCRFLHVSTDEVYGELEEGTFSEQSPYAPNNPYSATKAGADHLVRSWFRTYGFNTVTTNCSNNFGPHQHPEKLIPTVILSALRGRAIPIYGQGTNVRDWLYVREHCSALDTVFHRGVAGETYVVGTRNEWRNIDLVKLICRLLDEEVGGGPEGSYANLITFVTDRPGHDMRYAIDPTKIETELDWQAGTTFEEALRRTVLWYHAGFNEGRWPISG